MRQLRTAIKNACKFTCNWSDGQFAGQRQQGTVWTGQRRAETVLIGDVIVGYHIAIGSRVAVDVNDWRSISETVQANSFQKVRLLPVRPAHNSKDVFGFRTSLVGLLVSKRVPTEFILGVILALSRTYCHRCMRQISAGGSSANRQQSSNAKLIKFNKNQRLININWSVSGAILPRVSFRCSVLRWVGRGLCCPGQSGPACLSSLRVVTRPQPRPGYTIANQSSRC